MIETVRIAMGPSVAPKFRPPATASEAKRLVRDLNARERHDREATDRQHAARSRAIDQIEQETRAAQGPRAASASRLTAAEIYGERNRVRDLAADGVPIEAPAAGRPLSFASLAAEIYGCRAAIGDGDTLIHSSPRGGVA